jgi:hypothetical protein
MPSTHVNAFAVSRRRAQFDVPVVVDEKVGRFDVAVNQSLCVHIREALYTRVTRKYSQSHNEHGTCAACMSTCNRSFQDSSSVFFKS